jgi:ribonuclease T1
MMSLQAPAVPRLRQGVTVVTPGPPDRGARRAITGSGSEGYWPADHYASFRRIEEGA